MFKCRYCGKVEKSKKDMFFIKGERNENLYFCNEDEFHLWLDEQNKERKFMEDAQFLFDMNLTIVNPTSWKAIAKCVENLRRGFSRDEVLYFIESYMDKLCKILSRKSFDNEYGMVRYLSVVLENNIAEYLKSNPLPKETQSEATDFYMSPVKYKPSNQRRAMVLIETMEDDEENG